MKRSNEVLILTVALAAAFLVPSINAQPAGPKGREERQAMTAERRAEMLDRMAEHLGLTVDQKKQVQAIQDSAEAQREAVFKDAALTREQRREKLGAIQKDTQAKIDAILTPEQREKMATMRGKMKDRMGERRERRGPGEDGPPPPKDE